MSRIQIPAVDVKNPEHEVWVGYDSPLETYFGQVFDAFENIFWCGASGVGEIQTIDELEKVLEPYCNLSLRIKTELHADYLNRTEPSALQRWGRTL